MRKLQPLYFVKILKVKNIENVIVKLYRSNYVYMTSMCVHFSHYTCTVNFINISFKANRNKS